MSDSALSHAIPVLTPELSAKLIQGAGTGLFKEAVAQGVGITAELLDDWLRMGLSPGAVEPYRSFAKRYVAAERGCQLEAVSVWLEAARTDWKAAQAFLAARDAETWGPKATRNRQAADLTPSTADAAAEEQLVEQLIEASPDVLVRLLEKHGWRKP